MIQLPLQSAKQCSVTHMLGEGLRGKTAEKPKVKISLCCCCGGGLSGLPLTTFCSYPLHIQTLSHGHYSTDGGEYFLVAIAAWPAMTGFVGQTIGRNHNKRDRQEEGRTGGSPAL